MSGEGEDQRRGSHQTSSTWTQTETTNDAAASGAGVSSGTEASSGAGAARTSAPTTRFSGPATTSTPGTFGSPPTACAVAPEEGKGPFERLVIPSFSGAIENEDSDIGVSARSYLRQVVAWRKMTRLAKDKQALVLYQHLSGKAWVEAENLDVDRSARPMESSTSRSGFVTAISMCKLLRLAAAFRNSSGNFGRSRDKPSGTMSGSSTERAPA